MHSNAALQSRKFEPYPTNVADKIGMLIVISV